MTHFNRDLGDPGDGRPLWECLFVVPQPATEPSERPEPAPTCPYCGHAVLTLDDGQLWCDDCQLTWPDRQALADDAQAADTWPPEPPEPEAEQ
jgi:hypothetical protein